MKNYIFALLAVAVLSGCDSYTQTSSGKDYLAKHGMLAANTEANSKDFNQELIKAASVEPMLTFPARIGLAHIQGGDLSAISGEEAELWMKTGQNLGKDFGEFIPLSPLVANAVSGEVAAKDRVDAVMKKIRLGAARQHMDAVLVYETYSSVDKKSNLLAIANLTIIGGYLLPSQQVTTQGYGNAMLIDVMNGYPYGTVNAIVPKDESLSSSWGWGSDDRKETSEKIKLKVTEKLSTEAEDMFKRLRMELAEKRAKKN